MRIRFHSLMGLALSGCLLSSAAVASEVKLHCSVSKVGVKHPYLPSEITLLIEGRYEEFFLEDVKIPNVSTMPVPGEVTYQGRKKVRITWPSSGYVYQGNLLPQVIGTGRYPPEDFSFNLSLDKESWKFKVELNRIKSPSSNSGNGKGRCMPVS